MAAFVMFMYCTIERITSGIMSAGGITCSRNELFGVFLISRHWRRSPSWPYDALTVGSARAAVNDLTVSEARPETVVSKTRCGACSSLIDCWYRAHTGHNKENTFTSPNFPRVCYMICVLTRFQEILRIRSISLH